MNKGNQKGITLIALIITIIVMLILVAVAVTSVSKSGLFDHAKNATNQWATEQERESNLGDDVDSLIDEYVGDYYVDSYYDYDYDSESKYIALKNKKNNKRTEFQEAYVKYEGETIDITEYIYYYMYNDEVEELPEIWSGSIGYKLVDLGKLDYAENLNGTEQEIILVKDGIKYSGKVILNASYNDQEPPQEGSEE